MAADEAVPPFGTIIFPRRLRVDGKIDGNSFNYALETAAAVYERPEVRDAVVKRIEESLKGWQKPTTSALNEQVFEVLLDALVADLKANGKRYAEHPEDPANPVPGLKPGKTKENQAIVAKLISGARAELRENLIIEENLVEPRK
jgi:hypothetical protein